MAAVAVAAADEITATVPLASRAPVVALFVGDLDPAVTEEQLLEHFKNAGAVLSVRVCRDIITRRSLGYGYVNFQNHADAERAMNTLNFSQLGGRQVRLMWQQRDPAQRLAGQGNLFVKNLKTETDTKALTELFSTFGQILSAKVVTDAEGKCRGYGFVHFKDENSASSALTQMNGRKVAGIENPLYVAAFIRRNARIAMLAHNFTNVYIKHVLPNVEKADIEKFFSKFGGITSAIARKDSKGRVFAFCNFAKHDDAVKAVAENDKEVSGLTADGEKLYVARAQHRSERLIELRQRYLQRQSRGNNLYVRNFDPSFTEENLRELFKGFGEIKSCKVMDDGKGNPRGFGFVLFASADEANAALREMNGRMLNGKPLVVNVAQRRDQRLSMLQMQFQQRLQAMMRPMPMFPYITSGPAAKMIAAPAAGPSRTMKRAPKAVQAPAVAPAAPAAAPAVPELPKMEGADILALPPNERRRALGERLFARLMMKLPEEVTPKVTGMLLDLAPEEVVAMLNDDEALNKKMEEAVCVLRAEIKK